MLEIKCLQYFSIVLTYSRISNIFQHCRNVFKSSDDTKADNLAQGNRESVTDIVRKREEKVERGETESFGSDYLGSLIKSHHDGDASKRISIDEMIDECKTFYLAGQETTNSLLAWIFLLLSTHMDWQDKTRKEVLELFGQENPNQEGISKLKTVRKSIFLQLLMPLCGLDLMRARKENSKALFDS